jgi:hypothetical protein
MFDGSLFIGEAHSDNAELSAAGIAEGGDGPQLTIEAGATLAFASRLQFVIINRGATIFAVGSAAAPITLTSFTDVNGTVGAEDLQQWGGVVINGFGVSNKCDYTGTRGAAGFAPVDECNIAAEGAEGLDESYYGGDNDADTSGRLEYVVVKHTGAEVGNGDVLNGITFGGVGSNTIVKNLQMYSTYDDGIEMFGGAVNFENYAAVYVRDDSIDIDEGYIGTITNALVIQAEDDGNHCIEADGIGSYSSRTTAVIDDLIARGLNSAPTIKNLTCIISPNATGTHDPGAGWRFREGIAATIHNSLVISAFMADADAADTDGNYCFRTESYGTSVTIDGIIMACQDNFKDDGATVAATNDMQFATLTAGVAADPTQPQTLAWSCWKEPYLCFPWPLLARWLMTLRPRYRPRMIGPMWALFQQPMRPTPMPAGPMAFSRTTALRLFGSNKNRVNCVSNNSAVAYLELHCSIRFSLKSQFREGRKCRDH